MPYEHDIEHENVTSTVVWTISLAMFAAAVVMVLFAAAVTP